MLLQAEMPVRVFVESRTVLISSGWVFWLFQTPYTQFRGRINHQQVGVSFSHRALFSDGAQAFLRKAMHLKLCMHQAMYNMNEP